MTKSVEKSKKRKRNQKNKNQIEFDWGMFWAIGFCIVIVAVVALIIRTCVIGW